MAFKSDKDKEQFISKLQAAGFSPEEIDKEVGDIESAQVKQPVAPPAPKPSSQFGGGGSPLTTTAPPPVMEQPTAGEAVNKLADLAQQREEQKQDLIGQVWDTTAGKVLGGLGLAYGGYKLGRLAERKFGETTGLPVEQRVEPTMGTPRESARLPQQAQMSAEEQWRASLSPREQEMIARSEAAKASKAAEASARAAVTPAVTPEPPAFLLREPPAGAVTPPAAPAPVAPTAPTAPAPAEAAPPAEPVAEAPKAEPAKAESKAKPAKTKISMPEGWGKGMSWLVNQHGIEGAQAFIDQYNKGKPYATYEEMMKAYTENTMRPKYSDIPKSVRQERGITSRTGAVAIPPPSLQPFTQSGVGGGSLVRSLTDPLQLKQ